MGWFNKSVNSEEYEQLLKKLSTMRNELEALGAAVAVLDTNLRSLRGMINRRAELREGPEDKKEKNINSDDLDFFERQKKFT